ncbi:hypothetical protein CC85DRAFT_286750 [Cutaneotrichosporon oleaginosum]|uniref:Rad60/SUMO-like domain-containing protein n=1 Tax=Cutaneotrichosporon oleaginosum TaxID=879819 RepID=A0A0J0XJC5_9TREE|nr:uncharacterized protein CC85DRAFT_286750 [Cutaneotrichosporon oleaginosum]KLT41192.1 hypothetical protein CC85DRAFT_286750 [Cutaneotrichosporon oleaginosum]TXT14091.1 hypothetical protein COLE_00284 [Cutaneotrichosporon oleaginosum]
MDITSQPFTIFLLFHPKRECIVMRCSPTAAFRRVLHAYAMKTKECVTALRFDGTPITADSSPKDLCLPQGAIVEITGVHTFTAECTSSGHVCPLHERDTSGNKLAIGPLFLDTGGVEDRIQCLELE